MGLLDVLGLGDPDKDRGGKSLSQIWNDIVNHDRERDAMAAQANMSQSKQQLDSIDDNDAKDSMTSFEKMKQEHDAKVAKDLKVTQQKEDAARPKYDWHTMAPDDPIDPKSDKGKAIDKMLKSHPNMELRTNQGIIIKGSIKGRPNPDAAAYLSQYEPDDLKIIDQAETAKDMENMAKQAKIKKIVYLDPSGSITDEHGIEHAYYKPFTNPDGSIDPNRHEQANYDTLNRMMQLSMDQLDEIYEPLNLAAQEDHDDYRPGSQQFDADHVKVMEAIAKANKAASHDSPQKPLERDLEPNPI